MFREMSNLARLLNFFESSRPSFALIDIIALSFAGLDEKLLSLIFLCDCGYKNLHFGLLLKLSLAAGSMAMIFFHRTINA
jgi:hypothetical protein